MITSKHVNIDQETINKLGLKLSHKFDDLLNTQFPADARIFEFPHLNNVFVMEADLYGNPMPEDSCFLAFYGHHGFLGKELKVTTLKIAKEDRIKKIVEKNAEG